MFKLPTNIRPPGFHVGLAEDPPTRTPRRPPASPCQPLVTILTAMRSNRHRRPASASGASIRNKSFR